MNAGTDRGSGRSLLKCFASPHSHRELVACGTSNPPPAHLHYAHGTSYRLRTLLPESTELGSFSRGREVERSRGHQQRTLPQRANHSTLFSATCINPRQLHLILRMVSFGTLHRVALVRTDVSEELSASFIRVTRICELGTTLAVTSNRRTLQRNTK
jgi:hypothetical protein